MEDRKKEWFGVTMAGSGGPVETVVLEVETVVGKQSFRWRQSSQWRQSCGRQKGHLRKLNGGFPGSLPPPFLLSSLETTTLQSLYVPEKTREDWVVSLGSLEESVGRRSRFRRGSVDH